MNQFAVPGLLYCFLTGIHVSQEASKVTCYSHLSKNFPELVVFHTKYLAVNEAEVDSFLKLSCFFDDPTDVGNLISGSFVFPRCSLYIRKVSIHILLKPSLKDFDHYLASM